MPTFVCRLKYDRRVLAVPPSIIDGQLITAFASRHTRFTVVAAGSLRARTSNERAIHQVQQVNRLRREKHPPPP